MTVRTYDGIAPRIAPRAYVDPAAVVIGRVTIGEDASIWPAAVLRGDVHDIHVGARTSIQDGSVLHVTHDSEYAFGGRACIVGSDVTVGHRVVLHACTVGNFCLIGMGSVVLDDVIVEDNVILGAGSLVSPGKRLESGGLYVGTPARRARDLKPQELAFLKYSAEHYVKLKDSYLV